MDILLWLLSGLSIVFGLACVAYSYLTLRYKKGNETANVNLHRARLAELQHSLQLLHHRVSTLAQAKGLDEAVSLQLAEVQGELNLLAENIKAQRAHLAKWQPGEALPGDVTDPETGIPKKAEQGIPGSPG